jgi:hypothetical protein
MNASLDRCDFDQCVSVHLHLCDYCEKERSCNGFSCANEFLKNCDRCRRVYDTLFTWLGDFDTKRLRAIYSDLIEDGHLSTKHRNCPHAEYMRRLYGEAARAVMKYAMKGMYAIPKRLREVYHADRIADALETLPTDRW